MALEQARAVNLTINDLIDVCASLLMSSLQNAHLTRQQKLLALAAFVQQMERAIETLNTGSKGHHQ
jgi:hypothetical protein